MSRRPARSPRRPRPAPAKERRSHVSPRRQHRRCRPLLELAYRGRTFEIDARVAEAWAGLDANRPLPVVDSLQAATALVHGLTFVTRNVSDLSGLEVPLLDPFGG